jgi:hypothetical protein
MTDTGELESKVYKVIFDELSKLGIPPTHMEMRLNGLPYQNFIIIYFENMVIKGDEDGLQNRFP